MVSPFLHTALSGSPPPIRPGFKRPSLFRLGARLSAPPSLSFPGRAPHRIVIGMPTNIGSTRDRAKTVLPTRVSIVDQVETFIAKKEFSRAIETLLAQSRAKPLLRRLRLKLADVYIMAGQAHDAVPVLLTLADQFASDGFVAKAIAMLKRVEKIEPGRRDVETRLAQLIQDKSRRTQAIRSPSPPPGSSAGMRFGLEEIDHTVDFQLGVAADDEEEPPPKDDLSTPLFDSLKSEELVAVMHGLELVSFEPGDLITVEGDEGDSMFILSSGKVKAYVRGPGGRSTKVQEFEEGDFFGEISVLTGKPRTATLAAAEPCDCLELSRAVLTEITGAYPEVNDVLRKFQEERAVSTARMMMAKRG